MVRYTGRVRPGFTLIELLVVIGLLAGLAGITMLIVPGALDRDRATTSATQLTSAMQISRARAMRDGLPRGIRLIYNGSAQITEYQYIESPPAFVPNPDGPGIYPSVTVPPPPLPPVAFVQFDYTTTPNPGPVPAGQVISRTCRLFNLTAEQQSQVALGGTLYLPTLGTWHKFPVTAVGNPMTLTLDEYPDGPLGGQTSWRTYHFGIYGPARPVLGEPTYQLPQRSCVDLTLSQPWSGAPTDYDILFAPSGQLAGSASTGAAGHVFLWVRDPSRPAPPNFAQAGEQIIVVIKTRSGALGTAPVDQTAPVNYFDFAKKTVSGQ